VIALSRARTNQAIAAGFRGQGRITNQGKLLALHMAGEDFSPSVWKAAKKQLRAETDGKCGYCEAKTDAVAHGDVEHFRPKSQYWWLAYCYDNYVFACQLCNQSFKGDSFPVNQARLMEPALPANPTPDVLAALSPDPLDQAVVDAFAAQCLSEEAGIPDPYVVDPEALFTWRADDTLREVEIQARDASPPSQRAFDAVERFLGLNRPELKQLRYKTFQVLTVLFTVLASQPPQAARDATEDLLRELMADGSQFAGMSRHFVREVQGLPL
jgi:uncharacterized protein (TIGR02646 family)